MKLSIFILNLSLILILSCQKAPKGKVMENPHDSEWYKKHLLAMKEPRLGTEKVSEDYFAYRVLYLPTWASPLCIRIETQSKDIVYRAIKLSGEGGYAPGEIKSEINKKIEAQDLTRLKDTISKIDINHVLNDETFGLDGTQLIIEIVQNNNYTVIDLWTPEYETKERKLQAVLKLFNQQFSEAGFYKEETTK
jgi:hypothetical protein